MPSTTRRSKKSPQTRTLLREAMEEMHDSGTRVRGTKRAISVSRRPHSAPSRRTEVAKARNARAKKATSKRNASRIKKAGAAKRLTRRVSRTSFAPRPVSPKAPKGSFRRAATHKPASRTGTAKRVTMSAAARRAMNIRLRAAAQTKSNRRKTSIHATSLKRGRTAMKVRTAPAARRPRGSLR